MRSRTITYTINPTGLLFMAAAVATLAGAFGGTAFQRGAAALLVMTGGEVLVTEVKTTNSAAGLIVWPAMVAGVALWAVAAIVMLGGLS